MSEAIVVGDGDDAPTTWSVTARAVLATLSAGAGIIHLAMVGPHAQESALDGWLMAGAGWFQLVVAFLLVVRPSRALLAVTVVANVVFIATWAVSRTAGLPWGGHAGEAEAASSVDWLCVALEALVIVGAGLLLARPRIGAGLDGRGLVVAAAVPAVVVMGLTTATLASDAGTHGSHGGTQADGGHETAAGHDHDGGGGGAGGDDHVVEDDLGLGMLQNGHHEEMVYTELSAEDQAAVDDLLEVSQEVVAQYPTLGEFKAAGAIRAGPFAPGLGAHYALPSGDAFNADGVMDETDMRNPLTVIFDGDDDTAPIAGFMYYSMAEEEPEGFPGANDYWHYHTDVCTVTNDEGVAATIGSDDNMSAEECERLGGTVMASTQWMVHVWSVPGYEVAEEDGGVFAEVNPKITCPDGTYYTMEDRQDLIDHPLNACRSELEA